MSDKRGPGQPPKGGRRVQVRLPDEVFDEVDRRASDQDLSRSDYLAQIIIGHVGSRSRRP